VARCCAIHKIPHSSHALHLLMQSLEDEMVRGQVLRLVSLPLWQGLSPGRLQLELHALPQLGKHWKHLLKKEQKVCACLHVCVYVCMCVCMCVRARCFSVYVCHLQH